MYILPRMFNEGMKPALLVAALIAAAPGCSAAPEAPQAPTAVRVLSSNGVKAVIEALQPEIERAIGHPLSIEFSTASSLKTKIEAGEVFDVAILTPALVDDLIAQGKVAADSRVDFARTGVGVGVRQGAPVADVSTPDALKSTLLEATSVVFTADGQSRITIDRAFDRLGIAEAMRPKTILKGPGEGSEAVAAGEAELVLTLMSEILPVPGVQLLGPFPADVQGYVSFTAGRSPGATNPDAAGGLLGYLSTPAMAAALKASGLEPIAPVDAALLAADRALVRSVAQADTTSALSLMDDEVTWTDAEGRTLTRAQMTQAIPAPAIPDEGGAEIRRFDYGQVGVVEIDRDRLHSLRVWVRRPAGWRLMVYQEVRSLAAPPTVTPGTGAECVNPCRTVPYEPTTPNERGVIAAFQALETAAHAADAVNFAKYVADEFVVVSSHGDRPIDKQTRINGLLQRAFGGVSPTQLLSARLFDFDTAVVMLARHQPNRGAPLHITRVWVDRNGTWMSALSYQTAVGTAAAAGR